MGCKGFGGVECSLLLVLHGLVNHIAGLADLGRLDRLFDEVVGTLAELLLLLVEAPGTLGGDTYLGLLRLMRLLILRVVRLRFLITNNIG